MDDEVILEYYLKEIHPLAEHGVVIWNSGLTKSQENELENIQKIALKIILEDSYISYELTCTLCNILPLKFRRLQLCTNFTLKLFKSDRSCEYSNPAVKIANTRNEQQLLVKEKKSNTKRCYDAPYN